MDREEILSKIGGRVLDAKKTKLVIRRGNAEYKKGAIDYLARGRLDGGDRRKASRRIPPLFGKGHIRTPRTMPAAVRTDKQPSRNSNKRGEKREPAGQPTSESHHQQERRSLSSAISPSP